MDDNSKMNATLDSLTDEIIDIDELETQFDLEAQLENELAEKMSELQFLESEREQIGDPDALGSTIKNVVWEQFLNQIAVTAGEDFINDNEGMKLDLSNDAHIQTAENFAEGKIASHNKKTDYQKRYDEWQDNFQKNEDGSVKTKEDYRTKEERAVLRVNDKKKDPNGENYNTNYDAREFIDKGRPTGSKTVNKDHTIPAAEIIRDPEAAAYMTRNEQAAFANSDVNLVDLDSAANQSKSDSSMTEFLDSERTGKGAGQSQAEYFGLDEEELRARDKAAREEYEKQKADANERAVKEGRKSQKKEAFRIGKKALRAVAMQLLADLLKEIIGKLVKWFKDKKKSFNSLIDSIISAIKSFKSNLKKYIVNATDTLMTTIATAIIGPVVGTIKKVWMMLKQGWKSLKDAVAFLKNPANQGMPMSLKVLEIGKIVMAGLSGIGALVLGEVIEKGLMTVPAFAVEIPLLGSLANIIGIFMGAVVAGIIGAIVINLLDNATAKKRRELLTEGQVDKGNEILKIQRELRDVTVAKTDEIKKQAAETIKARHTEAGEIIRESVSEIFDSETKDNKIDFDEIDSALDGLLDS